jgi:hypothetical protein
MTVAKANRSESTGTLTFNLPRQFCHEVHSVHITALCGIGFWQYLHSLVGASVSVMVKPKGVDANAPHPPGLLRMPSKRPRRPLHPANK